jgi:hypothetical protein
LQNLSSDILVKALFLFVCVICGFAALNMGQIRRLKNVAAHLSGSLAFYSLFLPAVEGIYENLRFSVHAGPRFLEVPGTLKIRLFVRPLIALRVFRRSLLAKAAGKIRLLPEVKTGDPLFDAEFAIFARDAATVRSYLQQAVVRQSLRALLEYGFWILVIDKHGSWAEKLAYDRKLDLEVTSVSAFLRYLKLIAIGV